MQISQKGRLKMLKFIHLLNDSPIVFIADVRQYGWPVINQDTPKSGYEVYSPGGEIKCFDTWHDAHKWRVSQINEILESHLTLTQLLRGWRALI